MAERAEKRCEKRFREIDRVAEQNTLRVMAAFQDQRVSDACFAGTTGYGYDDLGRETLDKIYAQLFGTESALVRLGFVNGTHALTAAMFSLARPGETVLAVTGTPYDTLRTAIGLSGNVFGSLKFYGVNYAQVDLAPDGRPDYDAIRAAVSDPKVKGVMIQRSRGYEDRKALSVKEIGRIVEAVREVNREANIMVDNCYGEFTDVIEPTHVGADIIAGSLIKNPGGGVARIAKEYGRPVIAFSGSVSCDAAVCNDHGIDAFFPILRAPATLREAMEPVIAQKNLADTAEQVFRLFMIKETKSTNYTVTEANRHEKNENHLHHRPGQ